MSKEGVVAALVDDLGPEIERAREYTGKLHGRDAGLSQAETERA